MIDSLPFEWFILLLRVSFIFLLYFFLFQVVRVIIRELSSAAQHRDDPELETYGHLVVRNPGNSGIRPGTLLELDPVTVIGRHPRATIRIDDTFVSSEHVQVAWTDGRWWVTDLNSTNGTVLNGQPVTVPTGIRIGDVIAIGDIQLQLAP